MLTKEMISQYVAGLLRTVAAPVIVFLTANGYLTDDQAAQAVIIVVSIGITFVSSLWNKFVWNTKVDTALELPAKSSRSALDRILKYGE